LSRSQRESFSLLHPNSTYVPFLERMFFQCARVASIVLSWVLLVFNLFL
jgi:hypothetical protein